MKNHRRGVIAANSRWIQLAGSAVAAVAIAYMVTTRDAKTQTAPQPSGTPTPALEVCNGQPYALCATARCTVYDGVAYCQCDEKVGDSITLPFQLSNGQDVCSLMAEGSNNGFLVSTYSLPASIVAPNGNQAIYNCPGGANEGAYAQCDGGLCFTSTEQTSFPGLDQPIPKGQVICSCPISTPGTAQGSLGHQIAGPYPCQQSYFQNCNIATANSQTGSTIYVGSPAGGVQAFTAKLNGSVPTLNQCNP